MKHKSQFLKFIPCMIAIIFFVVLFLLISQTTAKAARPQVAAGGYHTVGLKSDGTVVAVGDNHHGECNLFDWHLEKINPIHKAQAMPWIPLLLLDEQ